MRNLTEIKYDKLKNFIRDISGLNLEEPIKFQDEDGNQLNFYGFTHSGLVTNGIKKVEIPQTLVFKKEKQ